MATGTSILANPTWCADSIAALRVVNALGASSRQLDDSVSIDGGIFAANQASSGSDTPLIVSCGESGLCLRMFSAIASLSESMVELRGEGSLRGRPVGPIAQPLAELGVRCTTLAGLQPIRVQGAMRSGTVTVDGSSSSQFITGLLLALPMTGGDSVVHVRNLASRGYLDLTIDVMRAFGAVIERDADFSRFDVRGRPYTATSYGVEGDWSGAAFLLVAGAIAAAPGGLAVWGLSPRSSQPDRAIIKALDMAGARCEEHEDGYRVHAGPLRAFSFDASDCPDLFPPLVALASRCPGATTIRGAGRLRAKESDRAAALSGEFSALGLGVDVDGDVMTVHGRADPLAGGTVSSHGDHRIAMAAAVAALAGSGAVTIDGAECVGKSWPEFFEVIASIRSQPAG
jgi:3-phosphoshikimate 1-carboxyvinyltransferase